MTVGKLEITTPYKEAKCANDDFDREKGDHEPETEPRQPMTIDHRLVAITPRPTHHKRHQINHGGYVENDALAPVHGRVAHEIDPDRDRVHEATHGIKDHHVQDAHEDLAKHDAFDVVSELS